MARMASRAAAVVSTMNSGSLTGDCPMADVTTVVNTVPGDVINRVVGVFCCCGHRLAETDDSEHAATAGHDVVSVCRGTCMKDFLRCAVRIRKATDRSAFRIAFRVASGGQNDTERGA